MYSHSLPKGRPNQYFRMASVATGGGNSEYDGAVGNVRGAGTKRKAGGSTARDAAKGASRSEGAAHPATTTENANSQLRAQVGGYENPAEMRDLDTMDPLMTSTSSMPLPFTTAPTLPWLGHWSWTDALLDSEMEGLSAPLIESSGLPAQDALFGEQLSALPEWDAALVRGQESSGDAPPHGQAHGSQVQIPITTEKPGGPNESDENSHVMPGGDAKGPSATLVQLTQLSMKLYPLHSKSQALAECAFGEAQWKSKRELVVDKDVFGTLMSPLIHDACSSTLASLSGSESPDPASLGAILQEAMYATHELLESVAQLQQQQQQHPQQKSAPTVVQSPKGGSLPTPAATPKGGRGSQPGAQSSSPVVRHLVSSCHGMLMAIYSTAFEVLQRDADWLSPMRRGELGLSHGPLGDARLVVIVQLCAYLVYRQQAAVDAYITPGSRPNADTAERSAGTAVNELETEMRLGLDRLRSALSIR